MNKVKFLSLVAIGLLISNLMLVAFVLFRKPPHPPKGGPRNVIIEKLHFDGDQTAAYDKLIAQHRNDINNAQQGIRQLKQQLYATLTHPAPAQVQDSLIQALGNAQIHIEQVHYHHFQDLQRLCKPEQAADFAHLTEELGSLFGGHERGKRP